MFITRIQTDQPNSSSSSRVPPFGLRDYQGDGVADEVAVAFHWQVGPLLKELHHVRQVTGQDEITTG